jgi:hypothetical protein
MPHDPLYFSRPQGPDAVIVVVSYQGEVFRRVRLLPSARYHRRGILDRLDDLEYEIVMAGRELAREIELQRTGKVTR